MALRQVIANGGGFPDTGDWEAMIVSGLTVVVSVAVFLAARRSELRRRELESSGFLRLLRGTRGQQPEAELRIPAKEVVEAIQTYEARQAKEPWYQRSSALLVPIIAGSFALELRS